MLTTRSLAPSAGFQKTARTYAVVCGCPMMTPMGWCFVWQAVVVQPGWQPTLGELRSPFDLN